jgi:DNA-directed RNA polymerase specialized sigma24 family protein
MKTEWRLTREAFENLLSWLSPDREQAAHKYEETRTKLIKFFTWRGCPHPEDLTDKTINRVIKAMEFKASQYSGEPVRFFYGVAKNVYLEFLREKTISPEDIVVFEPVGSEQDFRCLESCMASLPEDSRKLISAYYDYDGPEKSKFRQTLADTLGIGLNPLRIKAFRIRNMLRDCVFSCIQSKAADQGT